MKKAMAIITTACMALTLFTGLAAGLPLAARAAVSAITLNGHDLATTPTITDGSRVVARWEDVPYVRNNIIAIM